MSDNENVTELNPQKGQKPKTPEQMVAEAQNKIVNRRNGEFQKTIDALVEKKVAAEKAVALVEQEIKDAIAKFQAGL